MTDRVLAVPGRRVGGGSWGKRQGDRERRGAQTDETAQTVWGHRFLLRVRNDFGTRARCHNLGYIPHLYRYADRRGAVLEVARTASGVVAHRHLRHRHRPPAAWKANPDRVWWCLRRVARSRAPTPREAHAAPRCSSACGVGVNPALSVCLRRYAAVVGRSWAPVAFAPLAFVGVVAWAGPAIAEPALTQAETDFIGSVAKNAGYSGSLRDGAGGVPCLFAAG